MWPTAWVMQWRSDTHQTTPIVVDSDQVYRVIDMKQVIPTPPVDNTARLGEGAARRASLQPKWRHTTPRGTATSFAGIFPVSTFVLARLL